MARSNLAKGKDIFSYMGMTSLMSAFGSESAIRAEYSRMRSIIRKRVERMEQAGERSNWVYQNFGDLKADLPALPNLSTKEVAKKMTAMARVLSGGHQSTVREIRQARKEALRFMVDEAENEGDTDFAENLKKITPQQYDRARRLMGMMQAIIGKSIDSEDVWEDALRASLETTSKSDLLSKASAILAKYGIDDIGSLERLNNRFTKAGTTRKAWSKAHKGRK